MITIGDLSINPLAVAWVEWGRDYVLVQFRDRVEPLVIKGLDIKKWWDALSQADLF